ncbi:SIR2 family NAD-dependent protein deacylase [Rhodoligotrophos ferricapiens]|uniref:SIR2 family NAD-dependent protein deacylase n=1 Tax=Rhodoligotrophos ferricapiens TaxID=3069264 RepID=UPI00315D087F
MPLKAKSLGDQTPDIASAVEELADAICQRKVILFVGAGVSMNVGLPSWSTLIEHMVEDLGLDKHCAEVKDCSYQMLAEYYRLKEGSIGPLRSWMDRNWKVSDEKVKQSRLHKLIVELDFPIIYTTNYDRNLEVAFTLYEKPFVKIATAKDVAKAAPGVTQIIKYHGDFDEDASLVLAETDYFNRLSFETPLDLKFRSDSLGNTILFIGYSMSDMNIRLLLHRLWEMWSRSGYEKDRPRSYVFMPNPNQVQEAILARWGISMVSEDAESAEDGLYNFLCRIRDRVKRLSANRSD